jgi:hypothetical protein
VTPSERQLVLQATMEVNVSTSSRSPHTHVTIATSGGILPPLPPFLVRTIDYLNFRQWFDTVIGVDHYFLHLEGDEPSFLIWDAQILFKLNYYLLYLTDHRFGGRDLKHSHQASIKGGSVPFNAIPYGGDHIPPLSPFLGGDFQFPVGPITNYILYGGGSLGPLYYTM